ncbi:thiol:disulfide interchange protein DsbA/DsbL [Trabulsiella odontotermitis]|uniref:Thiol:disulfide interchange protein DsbA n=1 Tax=Trabulsiella odontotermitis TaxID=379893 RepID=A0A0L0H489_9ENTR|nr:thiol:disulfide interchange protein DsbA/DsbL [Trabulsiella odontotermitis]KNC95736.1 thiol:disulfide interchange protein [Trabulsiella odontotermitis]
MAIQFKRAGIISYSLFLIIVSALMTVLCYHLFVFNTFATDDTQTQALREVSAEQVKNSPIKDDNSIIEVMSYGCHYCAANEENLTEFTRTLPPGAVFKTIHITSDTNGLAAYAPVFATLEEMGLEEKTRDSAYNAIITRNVNLADEQTLLTWLVKNNIDVKQFQATRQSDAVKARLANMAEITRHYDITATPMFIINKRYVVAQDRDFPDFAKRMQQLLTGGK